MTGREEQEVRVPAHVPQHLVQEFAFDALPGAERDPVSALDAIRDGRDIVYAPAARRGRGTWVLKRYDHIVEALQAADLFSSHMYSGFSQLLGEDWPLLPLDADAPMHMKYRLVMLKLFSAKEMNKLEGAIAETVRRMTDVVAESGRCDFQDAIGRQLPTTVFLRHMGLPVEDSEMFLEWEHALMRGDTLEIRAGAARSVKDYLMAMLAERAARPRADGISAIAQATIDDRPATDIEKLGMCYALYGAGLDTVASALGSTFLYLAENPEQQMLLRNAPHLREGAVEEFLRAKSMVVMGRIVTRDVIFHGVQFKQGDFVSLPTMMANRDPAQFEDATGVNFNRSNIRRHIGFSTGPHNCLGAHLARIELRLVLDEWLDRIGPFWIEPGAQPEPLCGIVFGVKALPLQWSVSGRRSIGSK